MLSPGSKAPTAAILVAVYAAGLVAFLAETFGLGTVPSTALGMLTGAASALYYGRRRDDGGGGE